MNFKALSKTSLFYGTTPREAEAMLNCLGAVQQCFTKGKTIYHMGDSVTSLGMVLSGSVLIENDEFWGNTSILDSIGPGTNLRRNVCMRLRGEDDGQCGGS